MSYTAGPWKVIKDPMHSTGAIIVNEKGTVVAVIPPQLRRQYMHNALLVAQAIEMIHFLVRFNRLYRLSSEPHLRLMCQDAREILEAAGWHS